MSAVELVRRLILALLPWYRSVEVEARHAATADALTVAAMEQRRIERTIASYRAADQRISRL